MDGLVNYRYITSNLGTTLRVITEVVLLIDIALFVAVQQFKVKVIDINQNKKITKNIIAMQILY